MLRLLILSAIVILGFNSPAQNKNLRWNLYDFFIKNDTTDTFTIDSKTLYSNKELKTFYQKREYNPVWFNNLMVNQNGKKLLKIIKDAKLHGLNPSDYHLQHIRFYFLITNRYSYNKGYDMMKLELLLSDAFFMLTSHLYYGKVNPENLNPEWQIQNLKNNFHPDIWLQNSSSANISLYVEQLLPQLYGYSQLKNQLTFFREIEKSYWPTIKPEKALKPDMQDSVIPLLRERLNTLGYKMNDRYSTLYDDTLAKKIKEFQFNNGLNADATIGKLTIDALNTTPIQKIKTIIVNMERMRWLPKELPTKYILVNIANAELDFIYGFDTIINMRAIVGRDYRKTPVFSASMSYIVFSPTWTVPPTILREDIIPEFRLDAYQLEKKQMKVLRYDGTEVDASLIDWEQVNADSFPYLIRQKPGATNALGRIKFMFPNEYNVYIHDTPSRTLFAKDDRTLSSGCIRIEKAFDLAKILLASNPEWNEERILKATHQNHEIYAHLRQRIPIYIVYLTSWASNKNEIHFRRDVYNRDLTLYNALHQKQD